MTSPLFEELELRGLTLPNRIIVAPMCQYSASNGSPTDWHLILFRTVGAIWRWIAYL